MIWSLGATLLVLVATPAFAFDTVLNFTRAGTATFLSGGGCGISVSSSAAGNPVNFSPSGLGHVGGGSDLDIDPGETLSFTSSLGARPAASYRVSLATNTDGDGLSGETFVEAFVGAVSLGVEIASGAGAIDVAALFGGAAISRFQVTALETIRISRAQWKLPPGMSATADVSLGSFSAAYTFASPLLQCGLRVETDDGAFHVAGGGEGLGIVGGASDRVDAGESLLVLLGEPIQELEYRLVDSTDVGGTFEEGDHFIEAFDANGTSLGLRSGTDTGTFIDLTALYGGASIQAFELLAVNDSFRLDSVRLVPEPASGGALAALAGLVWVAYRRQLQATPSTAP